MALDNKNMESTYYVQAMHLMREIQFYIIRVASKTSQNNIDN